MTVALGKRHNATGRSSGKLYTKSSQKITEQFVPHRISMLESPTWRALSFTARRILDRLEIEHLGHAGRENGSLIVTYDDFKAFGIRRSSISAGLIELEALGFLEVTQRGRMAAAEFKTPSKYRLTYLPAGSGGPTDEWSRVAADEEATAKLEAARSHSRDRAGKQDIDRGPENGSGHRGPFSGPETTLVRPVFGSGPGPINGSGKAMSAGRVS